MIDDDNDGDLDGEPGPNGLASRKRLRNEYQITSQNDQDRQGGNRNTFLTVSDALFERLIFDSSTYSTSVLVHHVFNI